MLLQDKVDFDDPERSRSAWSRFLMSLIYRNPEGMMRIGTKVAAQFPTLLETTIRSHYQSTRIETDPETFEEFRSKITQKEIDEVHLLVMQRIMDSQSLGTLLNQMQWAVIRFSEAHHRLMTSDRPICMTPGLGKPNAVLIMPISPRQIFIAAHHREILNRTHNMAKAGGLAQRLNNALARQSRKYVYSVDDAPLQFVERRLGDKLQWCPWE